MKKIGYGLGLVLLAAGCRQDATPAAMTRFGGTTHYTCCNLHYEGHELSDANYFVGNTLPFGTPVRIGSISGNTVVFKSGDTKLTLEHHYGEETLDQYLAKIFVDADPTPRVMNWPAAVRRAVEGGRVERGMTKDQVIVSLGYPPTHKTPSTRQRDWTYWYNRWVTYKVYFDDAGRVSDVVGRPAPTAEIPIRQEKGGKVVTRKAPPLMKKKAKP